MTTGTIKKVVSDRGFGFISAEDEKEYFFHRGGLDSSLDFDRLVEPRALRLVSRHDKEPPGPHLWTRRLLLFTDCGTDADGFRA